MTPTPTPTQTPPQPEPETETIDPNTLPRQDIGFWLFLEEIPVLADHDTGGPLTPPPTPPPRARPRRYWGDSDNSGFWRAIIWLVFIILALATGGLIGEVANRILKPREG